MGRRLYLFLWPSIFFLAVNVLAIVAASKLRAVLFFWPKMTSVQFLIFYFSVTVVLLILFRAIRIPYLSNAHIAVLRPIRLLTKFCRIPAAPFVFWESFIYRLARLKIWLHDLIVVILLIFVALDFGSMFSPGHAVIIIGVIAIYDLLAVYVFKSMVEMSSVLIRFYLIPGVIFPKIRFSDFNSSLGDLSEDFDETKEVKLERFSLLGGGDIGIPAILTVSVMLFWGLGYALAMVGFSLLGLLVTYFFFILLGNRPFPALSFIGLSSITGFLLISLFTR
ncbi:MAG: presenilin family intramembrane aspartyl protease [Patescibacteria group bacterium]